MAQELGMGLEELDLEMFGQEVDQTSEVVFTDPLTAAGGGTALVVIFFCCSCNWLNNNCSIRSNAGSR